MRTPEFRKLPAAATAMLAVFTLAACGRSAVDNRKEASTNPTNRYGFDYGEDWGSTGPLGALPEKTGCLHNTPYASSKVVVTWQGGSPQSGIIDVQPSTGGLAELQFTGFNNLTLPIQPLNQLTRQVLEGAGCDASKHNQDYNNGM